MINYWSETEEKLLTKLVNANKSDIYNAFRLAKQQTGRSYSACAAHWQYMKKRNQRKGITIRCIRKVMPMQAMLQ